MPETPYAAELDAALAAARDAAAFIAAHAGGLKDRHGAASEHERQTEAAAGTDLADGAVAAKSAHDLVTFVDLEAQRRILAVLRARFPDDTVLAEEDHDTADGPSAPPPGRVWIVDPLDGTTNFSHGVPPYAVSIAMQENGRSVVAVVLDVSSGETFTATRGGGAWLDAADGSRRRLRVSTTDTLAASLLATGFPFRDYRYVDGFLETFEALIRATRGLRRHGSAAIDLAWTAAGRFEAFFEAGLAPWDVAAGVLLVEEAGGIVTPLGGADAVFSGGLTAAAPGIDAALRAACAPLGRAFAARADG